MSDFGHEYATGAGVHMDRWGAGPFKIEMVAGGRSFLFEDSDRFGPVPLKKNGWEVKSPGYFAENNQFWYAWGKWVEQGRRTLEDGITCVWDHENHPPSQPQEHRKANNA